MNKLLVVAALAVALATPAIAADLPVRAPAPAPAYKAPPAPVRVTTWTGCYLGANVGGVWAHKQWNDPTQSNPDVGSDTASSVIGGGQIGCDYQFGPSWVFGIQGSYDWTHTHGSHYYQNDPTYSDQSRVSSIATVTGRVGYLFTPSALAYVKGGGAWVRDLFYETVANGDPAYPGLAKATRSGWLVGG